MAEIQLVVFRLGKERFGVPITTVREIITHQRVTPIPEAPAFVEGIINLRGQIIPVVDLRKRLGLPGQEAGPDARIMVVDVEDRRIGCIVDEVAEVLRISSDVVISEVDSVGGRTSYLGGVAKVGENLVILLHLDKALTVGELVSA